MSRSLGESLAHNHTYRKRSRGNRAGAREIQTSIFPCPELEGKLTFSLIKHRPPKTKNEEQPFVWRISIILYHSDFVPSDFLLRDSLVILLLPPPCLFQRLREIAISLTSDSSVDRHHSLIPEHTQLRCLNKISWK